MIRSQRVLVSLLALVVFTGAGCFGGGTKAATGGVFLSTSAAVDFSARQVLPTASGVQSIDGLDILTMVRDPQDSGTVYAGSAGSGLLFSLNNGESWQRVEESALRSGVVRAVAVDPRDVCTYYVMKPDRLLKTTTCGRTFALETYVESRTDESLTAFTIDWFAPDRLWLATSAGEIIRSEDAGATWTTAYRASDDITSLMVSAADSRTILAGTQRNGLLRSTDQGVTWIDMEDAFEEYRRADRVVGFSQTTDGSVILLNTSYGIFTSRDQGAAWQPLSLVIGAGDLAITALAVAPSDANVIYYGTVSGLGVSKNGGSSWSTEELPSSRAASALLVHPENPSELFLGLRTIEE